MVNFGTALQKALPKMTVKELNTDVSIISRVVVHPKHHTIGLGSKLIKETLAYAGTPYWKWLLSWRNTTRFQRRLECRK